MAYVEHCAPGDFDNPGCAIPDCDHRQGNAGCVLDDIEHLRESVGAIVGAARQRGVQVIWIRPPEMGPPVEVDEAGVLEMWRTAVKSVGGLVFDTPIEPNQKDQIHYTRSGYEELAKAIWAFVSSRGKPRS